MKLSVEKSTLLKALSHGQSVVEKRNTMQILSHVLFEANDNTLKLTTTDMEMSLVEFITAEVSEEGSLTVSASMIFDIVRKVESDTITLFTQENQLHIHAGRSRFKLSYLSADDFPKLQTSDFSCAFQLSSNELKKLFDKPRFAMATEETRYFLNGIFWHVLKKQKVLRAVATDAHRLAYTQISIPQGAEDMPGVIISRKTVNEVRKLLDEEEKDVLINLSQQRIQFHFSHAELSSRLIDGTFPDYMQAIPSQNTKVFYIPTKDYMNAVDRVATVVNDKVRVIKMDVANNIINLSAVSAELGSAQEEIPVDYPDVDVVSIGFNAKYLLDITQHIDEEETEVALSDGQNPALLKGAGNEDSLFVLMPMRI